MTSAETKPVPAARPLPGLPRDLRLARRSIVVALDNARVVVILSNMALTFILWCDDPSHSDDPDEDIGAYLRQHCVTKDEAAYVIHHPQGEGISGSSGLPVVFGYTATGRKLAVVVVRLDRITVAPITAYEVL